MRGPGIRLDLDVRRVWRCPQCGKQRRVGGEVTTVTCTCGKPMQLVEEGRRRFREPQPLASRELTVASFGLTEEELSRPAAPPRIPAEPRPSGDAPPTPRRHAAAPRPGRDVPPESDVTPPVPAADRAADDLTSVANADSSTGPAPDFEDGFGAGLDEPAADSPR